MANLKKRKDSRFTRTITIEGRRMFIYGKTKDEADAKWLKIKNDLEKGLKINPKMTLSQWMIIWYDLYKRGKGALKTQEMYQYAINNYLHPAIGNMLLVDVRQQDIQALMNIIPGKATAHIVQITANQIFRAAVTNKHRGDNPVVDLRIPAAGTTKRAFLTDIQRNILLDALQGKRQYAFILTMLCTGMRMGEAISLLRDDVDLQRRLIHVTKAVEFDKVKPLKKNPKTESSTRYIPIPDELVEVLHAHLASHSFAYVFPGPKGGMFSRTSIDNWFRAILGAVTVYFKKHVELKQHKFRLNYRMLRHTYATALYDADIDPKMAQEIMGHSEYKVTMDIYTHIAESRREETMGKISNLYTKRHENEPPSIPAPDNFCGDGI